MTTQTYRIRASSWADLFDCPMRWKAKNLDGIRSPSSAAAHIGTSIHAGTAAFDQARLDGAPISPDDAAGALVQTLRHPEDEVVWADDDPSINDAEQIALRLHGKYCVELAPHRDYVAVEAACESLTVDLGNGIAIELTGTTDRVRDTPGGLAISDLKSGQRRCTKDGKVDAKADGAQLAVYELMAEQSLGKPITGTAEIIGLQTTKTGGVGSQEVPHTRSLLVGTEEQPGLLQMAGMYLKAGLFPPNPKSMTCSPKYCPLFGQCKFHN